jgi:hypothetical protein
MAPVPAEALVPELPPALTAAPPPEPASDVEPPVSPVPGGLPLAHASVTLAANSAQRATDGDDEIEVMVKALSGTRHWLKL